MLVEISKLNIIHSEKKEQGEIEVVDIFNSESGNSLNVFLTNLDYDSRVKEQKSQISASQVRLTR